MLNGEDISIIINLFVTSSLIVGSIVGIILLFVRELVQKSFDFKLLFFSLWIITYIILIITTSLHFRKSYRKTDLKNIFIYDIRSMILISIYLFVILAHSYFSMYRTFITLRLFFYLVLFVIASTIIYCVGRYTPTLFKRAKVFKLFDITKKGLLFQLILLLIVVVLSYFMFPHEMIIKKDISKYMIQKYTHYSERVITYQINNWGSFDWIPIDYDDIMLDKGITIMLNGTDSNHNGRRIDKIKKNDIQKLNWYFSSVFRIDNLNSLIFRRNGSLENFNYLHLIGLEKDNFDNKVSIESYWKENNVTLNITNDLNRTLNIEDHYLFKYVSLNKDVVDCIPISISGVETFYDGSQFDIIPSSSEFEGRALSQSKYGYFDVDFEHEKIPDLKINSFSMPKEANLILNIGLDCS